MVKYQAAYVWEQLCQSNTRDCAVLCASRYKGLVFRRAADMANGNYGIAIMSCLSTGRNEVIK
jgi:hypothetical protein